MKQKKKEENTFRAKVHFNGGEKGQNISDNKIEHLTYATSLQGDKALYKKKETGEMMAIKHDHQNVPQQRRNTPKPQKKEC